MCIYIYICIHEIYTCQKYTYMYIYTWCALYNYICTYVQKICVYIYTHIYIGIIHVYVYAYIYIYIYIYICILQFVNMWSRTSMVSIKLTVCSEHHQRWFLCQVFLVKLHFLPLKDGEKPMGGLSTAMLVVIIPNRLEDQASFKPRGMYYIYI